MEQISITIITNNHREQALLTCDPTDISISIQSNSGCCGKFSGDDFYDCLGKIRLAFPDTAFLCKGSKVNVRPSSMSSQMCLGVKAYEMTLGKTASRSDMVDIFEYEEHDLTNDPQAQKDFYMRWRQTPKTDHNY